MSNPINSILQQFDQQKTPTAPAAPAALPPPEAGAAGTINPVSDLLTKFDSGTPPPALPALSAVSVSSPVTPLPNQKSEIRNPVSDVLKSFDVRSYSSLSQEELKQSSRPDPENQIEEPWWSKTWDWMNKPLWDFHQYGTRTGAGAFERGIESGAEDLISAQSSPLSLALWISTFGGATIRSVKALIADKKSADKGAPNVSGPS